MLSRYVTVLLTLPAESLSCLLLCSQPLYPVEWPGTQLTERKLCFLLLQQPQQKHIKVDALYEHRRDISQSR